MNKNVNVIVASDVNHEMVFAEIYCHGKFVALVSQEEGTDRLQIEFPPHGVDEALIARAINVEDFRQGLAAAIERLTGKSEE